MFYLGRWGSDDARRFVTDLVHVPISLVYTVLGLRIVLRGQRTPRTQRAWMFITAAFGCRMVAQVSWFIEDAVLGYPSYPAVADYLFIAFVPLMFTGLLVMPTDRRSRIDRIKLVLDALIVAAGTFMILWYLLLGPIVVTENVPLHQIVFSSALPVGDLLLVLALAIVLMRRSTGADTAMRLLAAAVALFVTADVAYGYLQLHVGFVGGTWPDLFWLSGDYLLVLAAHQTYRQDHAASEGADRRGAAVNWLPYGAIALAYGLLGYLARAQGLYPLGGMIIGAIVMTSLVIARQMYVLHENRELAVTDPLTGLANRTMINNRVAALTSPPPRAGRCCAVLAIDLDRFKPINDEYGHEAGDAVLQAVAVALRAVIRTGDTAGRLGGDEFAVILRDLPDRAAAERIAARLVEALRTPVILGDVVLTVEASIGVAVLDATNPADRDQLLHQADVAMYTAKRSGRCRYEFYTPQLESGIRDAELRHAIDNDELVVHYQPAVALGIDRGSGLQPGDIVAFEALVRWNHPARGLLMPGTFIELAEETGAVVPMGQWVLREACRQVAAWRTSIPGADRIRLSVNLSPLQVRQTDLVDVVSDILDETGFPADRLVLEITESVALQPDQQTLARLETLHERGIRLAVDDFGTGYSALSYLQRFPVSILKIDRSFISGIADTAKARRIAEAVIRLGSAFDMHVVAEGIETAEQARLLTDMGCGFGQGYYFHRPLDPAAAAETLYTGARTA
ncbi:putative bifunctional diguanylate cyclase/phosphodiesterase [Catenuloplanes sp. NPDC051500]|uniref:putative bifunctional diguanylate cyclase/phosphodiesterase n=1 Tax=Catenuloplanes sp. NPDC051500 TaxID=3363959 RepID=UPI0037A42899